MFYRTVLGLALLAVAITTTDGQQPDRQQAKRQRKRATYAVSDNVRVKRDLVIRARRDPNRYLGQVRTPLAFQVAQLSAKELAFDAPDDLW